MDPILTLADLNRRNRGFWDLQLDLLPNRIANNAIRECAMNVLDGEELRGVPLKNRMSLEAALEYASTQQKRFTSDLARKGGQVRKRDALQQLIETIVSAQPAITNKQLLAKLERNQGVRNVVQDIEGNDISFLQGRTEKTAKITGLKDRLSRAKKNLRSR